MGPTWLPLISTLVGALIALTASLGNEVLKGRRERRSEVQSERSLVYSQYLATLTEAHESMRLVVRDTQVNASQKAARVAEVFTESRMYQLRYQIGLVADQEVIDDSESAFQQIRAIRTYIRDNQELDSSDYDELRTTFGVKVRKLQASMRREMGKSTVTFVGGS